jgi:hypothetical protein
MKKVVLRLSVVATASVPILRCNVGAQTLMRQITDQAPSADPIFVAQWPAAIPHMRKSTWRTGDCLRRTFVP